MSALWPALGDWYRPRPHSRTSLAVQRPPSAPSPTLWLVGEDNNPFLGSYGDPIARTPTLDQFAREGVRYANCFLAAPVCPPSRFALITGMYATSTGPAEHMRASGHPPVWLRGRQSGEQRGLRAHRPEPDWHRRAPQMNGIAFAGPRRRIRTAFASRDRMDERYDMQRTVRYRRNYPPHLPFGQYQKYVFQHTAYREWQRLFLAGGLPAVRATFWQEKLAEELYDLRTDRDEVRNLVGSAAHATILANLRQRLDQHMVAVNDNGFIPEGSPMEGYNASRVPGSYPMARRRRRSRGTGPEQRCRPRRSGNAPREAGSPTLIRVGDGVHTVRPPVGEHLAGRVSLRTCAWTATPAPRRSARTRPTPMAFTT